MVRLSGDIDHYKRALFLHHFARCDSMIGAPVRLRSWEISKTFRPELVLAEFLRANIASARANRGITNPACSSCSKGRDR